MSRIQSGPLSPQPRLTPLQRIADAFVIPERRPAGERLSVLADALGTIRPAIERAGLKEQQRQAREAHAAGAAAAIDGRSRELVKEYEAQNKLAPGLSEWWNSGYDLQRTRAVANDYSARAHAKAAELATNPDATQEQLSEALGQLREETFKTLPASPEAQHLFIEKAAGAEGGALNAFVSRNATAKFNAAKSQAFTDVATFLDNEEAKGVPISPDKLKALVDSHLHSPLDGHTLSSVTASVIAERAINATQNPDLTPDEVDDRVSDAVSLLETLNLGTGPLGRTQIGLEAMTQIRRELGRYELRRDDHMRQLQAKGRTVVSDAIVRLFEDGTRPTPDQIEELRGLASQHELPVGFVNDVLRDLQADHKAILRTQVDTDVAKLLTDIELGNVDETEAWERFQPLAEAMTTPEKMTVLRAIGHDLGQRVSIANHREVSAGRAALGSIASRVLNPQVDSYLTNKSKVTPKAETLLRLDTLYMEKLEAALDEREAEWSDLRDSERSALVQQVIEEMEPVVKRELNKEDATITTNTTAPPNTIEQAEDGTKIIRSYDGSFDPLDSDAKFAEPFGSVLSKRVDHLVERDRNNRELAVRWTNELHRSGNPEKIEAKIDELRQDSQQISDQLMVLRKLNTLGPVAAIQMLEAKANMIQQSAETPKPRTQIGGKLGPIGPFPSLSPTQYEQVKRLRGAAEKLRKLTGVNNNRVVGMSDVEPLKFQENIDRYVLRELMTIDDETLNEAVSQFAESEGREGLIAELRQKLLLNDDQLEQVIRNHYAIRKARKVHR
ncbi:hypothetical protein HED60_02750 [Planctomycetales bacterium ZRK34]|nr:hypothetical protein HED60_02750 [Planctomycetales bacterium ZRK34]